MDRSKTALRARPRTSTVLLPGLFIILALAAAYRWFLQPKSIEGHAVSFAQALFANDADQLVKYFPQYELDQMGMTREDAKEFLRVYLFPKVSGGKIARIEWSNRDSSSGKGWCKYFVVTSDNRQLQLFQAVYPGDEGPVVLLSDVMMSVWVFEDFDKNMPSMIGGWDAKAVWKGIIKDYQRLKQLGFKGMVTHNEAKPFLKPIESMYENALKRLEATENMKT